MYGGVVYSVRGIAARLQDMWACVHACWLACLHFHRAHKQVCVPAQAIFRSVSKLLMDTATSEYLFCCSFFQDDAIFHELFAATLTVVEASLAAMLQVRAPLTGYRGPSRAVLKLCGFSHSLLASFCTFNEWKKPTACHACSWGQCAAKHVPSAYCNPTCHAPS